MSTAENIEQGGSNTAALFAQKLIMAVAALACFAVFFRSALQMPPVRAAGDVGSAFLPLVMAVIGFALGLVYLGQVLTGRDNTKALAHPMALVLLVLTLGSVALIYGLGMPVALGAGAAIMVLVLERGKASLWAAGTGIVFWALTKFGFGMLLGVPLM